MLISTLIIMAVVLVDQLSKILVVAFLDKEVPTVIINGILRFSYLENPGMAFGLLPDQRWIFMTLSTVGIIAMSVYLYKFAPKNSRLLQVALALTIGGGIGNMIDRIFRSAVNADGEVYYFVVDFIDFYFLQPYWKWVFNIADACVCIGAGCLILYLVLDIIKDYKAKKLPAPEAAEQVNDDDGEE